MYVYIVFTQIEGSEIDMYEDTFLHQQDAEKYVLELNQEIQEDNSYFITVLVKQ